MKIKMMLCGSLLAMLLACASNAQTVGYSAITIAEVDFNTKPTVILQTEPVATTGVYYLSASATIGWSFNETMFQCYFAPVSTGHGDGNFVVGNLGSYSLVDILTVNAGDSIGFYCVNPTTAIDLIGEVVPAAMTATLVNPANASKTITKPRKK
jgi:hypothetical protein